ncbi:helix-turn-helix transcriptional regulator [Streptomyces antarcticus]|uniref:helix-turn-helix transcriptional regulator n=1 Tax=Streptomyces antarcticus TaxID=2996458 RepID=UPI00226F27B7|nr:MULTISPECIES: LuxR family transcriptional regulator [unclassified Streptomyces]MCY0939785.1 AAA family ATPase [Streptomyces sp. H34-AA3]MCZ4080955.1 AAA family ATPase [Streptomyces sp. H34-S5]
MILFGRGMEKAELDGVLRGARKGTGSALMLWGDPGIGKTALLDYATTAAADFTVLSCRGTRMESGLAFAALHELLWPAADRIDALPAPQAAALRGALGHSGDAADRFLIGVATLTLLSELACGKPVLITVDNADLLDEPTAECLAFVVRRLRTEPVALLLTGHSDPATAGPWELLPGLEVTPLSDTDAGDLVRHDMPGADVERVDRAVRLAAGNPLALRELPSVGEAGGESGESTERIPVGPLLRRAFGARTARLSHLAQTVLLVAAAEDLGDHHTVREAATALGAGTAAWDEALRSGLITIAEGRIRFRTALIAAVVYEEALFTQRQSVHRALAQALHGVDGSDLRAWHLAAAADTADEEVAGLLEHSAQSGWTRGGYASAARALRRAAELSPVPADAARRLALGALAAWDDGQVGTARELLDRADRLSDGETVVRESEGLRGIIEFAHGDQEQAHRLLLHASRSVAEPEKAVQLACLAVRAGWSGGSADRQAEAVHRLEELAAGADCTGDGLLPMIKQWWGTGPGTGTPPRADEAFARIGSASWHLIPPAPLAVAWGVEEPLARAYQHELEVLRRTGAVSPLVLTVPQTATIDIVRGRWTEAAANAADTLRVAEEIGADHAASQCRNSLAWLAALRGDEGSVTELTARTLELSEPRGVHALTAAAYWNRGMAALFAGRAQEALEVLVRLAEPGHRAAHATFALLAAADTVEAASSAGRPEAGADALRCLKEWARGTGAAWAVAAALRSEALLAEEGTEDLFLGALSVPGAAGHPFAHARTRLLYGEWLRRARRRTDARVQLAEAAETFQRLGATPLLERCLHEQELTGQRMRRTAPYGSSAEPLLTPQELRVARLAADGLTNREVAAQLLISPRTVGHHLSNVFPKLGIVARAELTRVDFDNGLRLLG